MSTDKEALIYLAVCLFLVWIFDGGLMWVATVFLGVSLSRIIQYFRDKEKK